MKFTWLQEQKLLRGVIKLPWLCLYAKYITPFVFIDVEDKYFNYVNDNES